MVQSAERVLPQPITVTRQIVTLRSLKCGSRSWQVHSVRRFESTVTNKGQVTIPVAFRRQLGLAPHDRVSFELDEANLRLRPVASRVLRHVGAIQPHQRPEDWTAMRAEVEQLVAEDVVAEDR